MARLETQHAGDSATAQKNASSTHSSEQPRALAKALKERHPYFELKLPLWQRLLDLAEGEYLPKYIHRHQRESKKSHEKRAQRAPFRDYMGAVIDLHRHYIFSKPIARSPIPAELQQRINDIKAAGKDPTKIAIIDQAIHQEWETEHLNDVDRGGTPIDRYMADICALVCTFGMMHVLVDMPRVDQARVKTEADRRKAKVRPYFVSYTPLEMVNWEIDEDGQYIWVRFLEVPTATTNPFESRDEKVRGMMKDTYSPPTSEGKGAGASEHSVSQVQQYRTITRTEWVVHQVKGDTVTEIARGPHRTPGEVPVVTIIDKRDTRNPFAGVSRTKNIATLQQAILNLDSLIDESTYQQCISILVMGRQPVKGETIVISESNVLEVSPTSIQPYFLTPSPAPLQFMEQRIQIFQQEIYRLAKFTGGFGLDAKAVAPTTAAFEFNLTNRSLADLASSLQSGERRLHRLWYLWLGKDYRGFVDYPQDFSIQSFLEDLQVITASGTAIRSPTFRKTLEKRVAKKILASEDESTLEEVEKEIDLIPEQISTFTGPIFFDPILQEVSNPAMGGFPIGKVGEMLREAEARGVDTSGLRPNATMQAETTIQNQQQQQVQQEVNLEATAARAQADAQKAGEKKPEAKKGAPPPRNKGKKDAKKRR